MKKIILYILLSIAAVLVGAGVSLKAMELMGKNALYAENEAPTLTRETAQDTAASAGQNSAGQDGNSGNDASAEGEESDTVWKDGWISYNGKTYEYKGQLLTFLFMGIDDSHRVSAKSGYRNGGQADVLLLGVMDSEEKKLSIIAVHRNTMTNFDMYDANGDFEGVGFGQICLAHEFGNGLESSCQNEKKAVKNLLYNVPINGYVSLNMGVITRLNDAVGGVTVPQLYYENGKIRQGDEIELHGSQAYDYIVERGEDFDSASYRLEKQKTYLRAFAKKLLESIKSDPTSAVNLYQNINSYMVTDITMTKVVYLANSLKDYKFDSEIYSLTGTTTVSDQGVEEFHYDEDALCDLMIKVFYKEVQNP